MSRSHRGQPYLKYAPSATYSGDDHPFVTATGDFKLGYIARLKWSKCVCLNSDFLLSCDHIRWFLISVDSKKRHVVRCRPYEYVRVGIGQGLKIHIIHGYILSSTEVIQYMFKSAEIRKARDSTWTVHLAFSKIILS